MQIFLMQPTCSPFSLRSQCVVRAVPLAPGWPERKVNQSAASTASLVQKEKLAMRQVCLKYIYFYNAHQLFIYCQTQRLNNDNYFLLFVRLNSMYQLSKGVLVQPPTWSLCAQNHGISFLYGTPRHLLDHCFIIWCTFMHYCFWNLHLSSYNASG